jgi:hypothetical protein
VKVLLVLEVPAYRQSRPLVVATSTSPKALRVFKSELLLEAAEAVANCRAEGDDVGAAIEAAELERLETVLEKLIPDRPREKGGD